MKPLAKIGAVVLAAGRGVRFRSASAKLLHPLGGRPLIQWPLAALKELGADPIVVIVGFQAEAVQAACGPGVRFAHQPEPHGTGHAVLMAAPAFRNFAGDLLILNGDLPLLRATTLRQLVATHRATDSVLTLATATVPEPDGWGRIVRRRGAVQAIVEERDASAEIRALREVNVGIYCLAATVLFPMLERVGRDNAQREIYLTDVVSRVVAAGARITDVSVNGTEVGQVNSRGDLATMEKTLRARINARWMEDGVTLEDPDTAYIGPDVQIGRDTVIGPNVQLRGRTTLGANCRLDGSARLTDATLGDGVEVKFGVVITEAVVGKGCQIGPFAQLRPGTRLAEGVHIGDFVETKNTYIGPRTKANHLAYLGDAEIGGDSNIGAGTITCNYDGFRKHRTIIGSRVQLGSDSQLVAPVALGDDVYVASGTTVRHDVPAGALVYNPRDQLHRSGWVAARRAREHAAAGTDVTEGPPPRPRAAPSRKGSSRVRARKRTAAKPKRSRRSGRA